VPSTGRPAGRKAALWLLIVALTAAAILASGEAVARFAQARPFTIKAAAYLGWARPDPVLGWRNNPGVHPADEPPHNPMTILPDGARETGPSGPGPAVWIVGCSYAEGYGVRDNETFAWKLQQRFPQLRIRDFGVPGYGTYQTLMLLRGLLGQTDAPPALVIYGFLPFHADRNVLTDSMLEAFRAFGGERFSPPHVEVNDGALVAYPPFVVPAWPLEGHSALVALLHRSELRFRLARRADQRAQATSMLLAQMEKLVESVHSRLLVATLADGSDDPDTYRRVVAGMQQEGIAQIDVTYAGAETRREKILVGGSGHPGAIIHSWWAGKLGDWIAAHRLPN
jgi:hypothetical protein